MTFRNCSLSRITELWTFTFRGTHTHTHLKLCLSTVLRVFAVFAHVLCFFPFVDQDNIWRQKIYKLTNVINKKTHERRDLLIDPCLVVTQSHLQYLVNYKMFSVYMCSVCAPLLL